MDRKTSRLIKLQTACKNGQKDRQKEKQTE